MQKQFSGVKIAFLTNGTEAVGHPSIDKKKNKPQPKPHISYKKVTQNGSWNQM